MALDFSSSEFFVIEKEILNFVMRVSYSNSYVQKILKWQVKMGKFITTIESNLTE